MPGAFTGQYSLLFPGARTLESFRDFGILPAFGGVVVSDRYQNYFHPDWKHIAGHQARCHRPAGAADTRSGRRSLANEAAVVLLPDGRTLYAKMPSTCV